MAIRAVGPQERLYMRRQVAARNETWQIVWKSCVIAVILFVVGVALIFPGFWPELILPDQTVYANGYSEGKFGQVKPGMEAQDVLAVLGTPLHVVVERANHQVNQVAWKDRPSTMTDV